MLWRFGSRKMLSQFAMIQPGDGEMIIICDDRRCLNWSIFELLKVNWNMINRLAFILAWLSIYSNPLDTKNKTRSVDYHELLFFRQQSI